MPADWLKSLLVMFWSSFTVVAGKVDSFADAVVARADPVLFSDGTNVVLSLVEVFGAVVKLVVMADKFFGASVVVLDIVVRLSPVTPEASVTLFVVGCCPNVEVGAFVVVVFSSAIVEMEDVVSLRVVLFSVPATLWANGFSLVVLVLSVELGDNST